MGTVTRRSDVVCTRPPCPGEEDDSWMDNPWGPESNPRGSSGRTFLLDSCSSDKPFTRVDLLTPLFCRRLSFGCYPHDVSSNGDFHWKPSTISCVESRHVDSSSYYLTHKRLRRGRNRLPTRTPHLRVVKTGRDVRRTRTVSLGVLVVGLPNVPRPTSLGPTRFPWVPLVVTPRTPEVVGRPQ